MSSSMTTNAVGAVYVATLLLGVPGNAWVVNSVMRSWRPRSSATAMTPSERLRTYIGLLGVVDLCVVLVLAIRCAYTFLPNATISTRSCQAVFAIDHLAKLASLSCLMCISVERYITIRKPFSSRTRKRLIHMTPLLAVLQLALIFAGIGVLSSDVIADEATRMNCVRASAAAATDVMAPTNGAVGEEAAVKPSVAPRNVGLWIAGWMVAAGFLLQLFTVSCSYSQIIRHVRRKFWQRKARVVANTHIAARKPLIVAEPRYMRDMTAAIMRVACFHVACLLPYCALQALPSAVRVTPAVRRPSAAAPVSPPPLSEYAMTALRFLGAPNVGDPLAWLALAADWLTYVNSAGNWIFYAAMNRDLRSIIRATTERRKRSTMSQHSPSAVHRSLRRQMTQSLRFFYSINSYRSHANSLDDSCSTVHNQPLTGSASGRLLIGGDSPSMSPPAAAGAPNACCGYRHCHHQHHKCSTASANGAMVTTPAAVTAGNGTAVVPSEGQCGMRNGRAHTYCSPRSNHKNGRVCVDSPTKLNGTACGGGGWAGGKQMFFPASGLSSGGAMSQLAATRKASGASGRAVAAVSSVNAVIRRHIDEDEAAAADTFSDADGEDGDLAASLHRDPHHQRHGSSGDSDDASLPATPSTPRPPLFSRIFLLSAMRMPVTITAKLGKPASPGLSVVTPKRAAVGVSAGQRHFANNILANHDNNNHNIAGAIDAKKCINT